MKGKLNEAGILVINRAGVKQEMKCPFTIDAKAEANYACGDWCPLFGEPAGNDKGAFLELCHATPYFEEFEDERTRPEGPSHLSLAE